LSHSFCSIVIQLFDSLTLGWAEFGPDVFEYLAFADQLLIALILLIGSESGSVWVAQKASKALRIPVITIITK